MKPRIVLSAREFNRLLKAPTFQSAKIDANVQAALREHYVSGRDSEEICQQFNIKRGRFSTLKTLFMQGYHAANHSKQLQKQVLIAADRHQLLLDAETVSPRLFPLMAALNGKIRALIGQIDAVCTADIRAGLRHLGLVVSGMWDWLVAFISRQYINWNQAYKKTANNPARQGWNLALKNAKSLFPGKKLAILREDLLLDWEKRPLWHENCNRERGRVLQFADYPTAGCCEEEEFEAIYQHLEAADSDNAEMIYPSKLRRNCLRAWAVNGNLTLDVSRNFGVPYYQLWRWLTRFAVYYARQKSEDFDANLLYQNTVRPYLPVSTDYAFELLPLMANIRREILALSVAEQGREDRMAALGSGVQEWLNAFECRPIPAQQDSLTALRHIDYQGGAVPPELYHTVGWNVCAEQYAIFCLQTTQQAGQ